MSFPSTSAEPEAEADQQAEDAQYYRRVLHELIDIGADLARMVHQQAKAQAEAGVPAAEPAPDATIAFDRIARTIRRSIALARTLGEPVPAPASHPGQHRIAARKHVIRMVEDAIHRDPRRDQAEALHAELLERLDGPDIDDDIGHCTTDQIIDTICHDLGLDGAHRLQVWKRRTPEDVALLCARAAKPSAACNPSSIVRTRPPPARDAARLHGTARFRGSG